MAVASLSRVGKAPARVLIIKRARLPRPRPQPHIWTLRPCSAVDTKERRPACLCLPQRPFPVGAGPRVTAACLGRLIVPIPSRPMTLRLVGAASRVVAVIRRLT